MLIAVFAEQNIFFLLIGKLVSYICLIINYDNSLKRDQLPPETDSYISVEYERKSDHLDHKTLEKNQKNQFRGEERERLKKEFKESGHTAQDFQ